MHFPIYPEPGPYPTTLATMVGDIAWQERESAALRAGPGITPATRLGNLCVALDDTAAGLANQAVDTRNNGLLFRNIYQLVSAADTERRARLQQRLHTYTIGALEGVIRGTDSEATGKISEYVCLALHTRYAHPSILAYPALPHYEHSKDAAGHFDVGAVYANPDGTSGSHFYQVKTACLGRCGQPASEQALKIRTRYREFIQFVSACCDLRLQHAPGGVRHTARTLIAEAQNRAAPEAVKALDVATDQLLFNGSSDLLLRGEKKAPGSDMASQLAELAQHFA